MSTKLIKSKHPIYLPFPAGVKKASALFAHLKKNISKKLLNGVPSSTGKLSRVILLVFLFPVSPRINSIHSQRHSVIISPPIVEALIPPKLLNGKQTKDCVLSPSMWTPAMIQRWSQRTKTIKSTSNWVPWNEEWKAMSLWICCSLKQFLNQQFLTFRKMAYVSQSIALLRTYKSRPLSRETVSCVASWAM